MASRAESAFKDVSKGIIDILSLENADVLIELNLLLFSFLF